MLERESTGAGWQVNLRPHGAARFVVVAFLSFWLCGWAAGEYFAGTTLLAGLRDLLAPGLELPWPPHMKNAAPSSPWPVLAFLGVWITFWTFGGLAAIGMVLRALAGVDRVRWDHEGVEVVHGAGPFASRRRLAWSAMEQPIVQRRGHVVARTHRGVATLAELGSDEDRRQLSEWLAAGWREAGSAQAEAVAARERAPAGWREATGEDGRPMLVSDAGALWLAFGRVELRPSSHALRRVRRMPGREWSREITNARLRLESSRDSDGDERWRLLAFGIGGTLELASDLHAPGAARHLGLWLAARMHVELEGLPGGGGDRRLAG